MTDMTVAKTILEQLGGRRFIAMTGAKNFLGDTNSLSFQLPARFAKNGINAIKIVLNGSDTYDVTFSKFRAMKVTLVASSEGVYAEDLRSLISEETGLALSL